jgi:hypothetical protein
MDRETLKAWLETRPQADSIAIAHRAALRVFWRNAAWLDSARAQERDLTSLPLMRSLVTSGVARKYPTPEVKTAASAAAPAANAAAADDASAASAASAGALWREVEVDITLLQAGRDLAASPVWSAAPLKTLSRNEPAMQAILTRDFGAGSFWHRWVQGALSGQQLNWDVQHAIALIPDEVWKAGPQAVMVEIEKIEAAYEEKREGLQSNFADLPRAT